MQRYIRKCSLDCLPGSAAALIIYYRQTQITDLTHQSDSRIIDLIRILHTIAILINPIRTIDTNKDLPTGHPNLKNIRCYIQGIIESDGCCRLGEDRVAGERDEPTQVHRHLTEPGADAAADAAVIRENENVDTTTAQDVLDAGKSHHTGTSGQFGLNQACVGIVDGPGVRDIRTNQCVTRCTTSQNFNIAERIGMSPIKQNANPGSSAINRPGVGQIRSYKRILPGTSYYGGNDPC